MEKAINVNRYRAMLEGETQPGVWFPEERGAVQKREQFFERAKRGCQRWALNKPAWSLESNPKQLGEHMSTAAFCDLQRLANMSLGHDLANVTVSPLSCCRVWHLLLTLQPIDAAQSPRRPAEQQGFGTHM